MSVDLGQTDRRGAGSGQATASGVLPLPAELDLWLFGGTHPSGIGGTAAVQVWYPFAVNAMAGGLPATVPVHLVTSGSAWVDSSLPDGQVGQTFARIDHPGGQIQASNEDPQGGHNGRFSFARSVALDVTAGAPQTVSIYLYSHGQGATESFFFHGHAFLDSIVTIDPGFALRDRFEVVYGPGVLAAAVPEAGTAGTMMAGLGVLGFLASRLPQRQLA